MDTFTLKAETNRPIGSAPSRRLRRAGKVPAVVYGTGAEPTALSVDQLELRRILVSGGRNALIDLAYDGAPKLAVVKDLQIHALRHDVTHVDFMLVERSRGSPSTCQSTSSVRRPGRRTRAPSCSRS